MVLIFHFNAHRSSASLLKQGVILDNCRVDISSAVTMPKPKNLYRKV